MSKTIEVYTFEDADGAEQLWTTQDATEAEEYARKWGYRVICHEFAWADSYPVPEWDYTPKTGDDDEEGEE